MTNQKCSILEVLMQRDGMTRDEALATINDAKVRIRAGEDPEEILLDEFGLEPDYILDLL